MRRFFLYLIEGKTYETYPLPLTLSRLSRLARGLFSEHLFKRGGFSFKRERLFFECFNLDLDLDFLFYE